MNKGGKSQSRFFTGHYSMAEVNSICKSGMGSIRAAKHQSTRRKSLTAVENIHAHGQDKKDITLNQISAEKLPKIHPHAS